ncbi:MAG: AtpZ/AtpI family protein [Planctomycetota bacterium]
MPEPEERADASKTDTTGKDPQPAWFRAFFGLGKPQGQAATGAGDERREKLAVAGAGIELAAGICLFAGVGYGLDHWLGTLPWGTVVGALLGFAAGLYLLIKSVARLNTKP